MIMKKIRSVMNNRPLMILLAFILTVILLVCAFHRESVHVYKSVITKQGNCVTPGERTFRCIKCSYKRTESVVGGHKFTDTLVIPVEGEKYILRKCGVCGDEVKEEAENFNDSNPYSLINSKISGVEISYQSTGSGITPVPVVKDKNKNELEANVDYTLTFENNVEPGYASVIVSGMGNYSNACEVQFRIANVYWDEFAGNKYYYDKEGMATGLKRIDGYTYYFNKEGVMQTGWQKIDDGYCCFDRISGQMVTGTQVDGIYVDRDGFAYENEYSLYKIETMMKAHKIVLEQTKPSETMEEKRLKIFNWELKEHEYHRWRMLANIYDSSPDWEIQFANDIFDEGKGCCVSDSCAVAFLFREIGYENIYVCHDTSHCWITVDGKLFDPLYAETKSFEENYNAKCKDERKDPVGRRRIDGVAEEDETDDEYYY